eukprot:CAMPEP_0196133614 /NCGR_PEP_ID=MMETSP0910-20130528/2766_1 /TAXON_ID=49265 /ORGANISM="Thalassiosira rotula, Strain GSO102" /LENGTH=401 /DNA_ID=CAMNT_0041393357 /DNA_START=59 /DNA_END=1261 /DNA_ORIENTATION=+
MDSVPPNPFSGADNHGNMNQRNDSDGDNFDAFSLSPVSAAKSSPMPSLESIHMQEQQQMQQQQQQHMGGTMTSQQQQVQQQLKFDTLPSPQELQMSGPMNESSGSTWPPPPPYNNAQPNNNAAGGTINNNNSNQSFLAKLLTCGGICSVESLRPYFDVDTADIFVRMKGALQYCMVVDGFRNEVLYSDNALRLAYRSTSEGGDGGTTGGGEAASSGGNNDIAEPHGGMGGNYQTQTSTSSGKGPDLYGPIWITLTLVFFVAVTSNMSLYIHHHRKTKKSIVDEGGTAAEEQWDYDINQLLHATWILYSFSIGLPSVVYFVFRLMGVGNNGGNGGLGLVELVCLYGYSLVPYLPAVFLCIVPASWLQWLFLAVATTFSGMLVLRNLAGPILESGGDDVQRYV